MAAAGLPLQQRAKAVLAGVVAAAILRITFAAATTKLLQVVGLVLAGGILLLWVSWKMFRELRLSVERKRDAIESKSNTEINAGGTIASRGPQKSFAQAASQIVVADVSMSLDNVLAVAGAAREYPAILIIGLALSVGLTGVAAGYIAGLLRRHQWIAYAGIWGVRANKGVQQTIQIKFLHSTDSNIRLLEFPDDDIRRMETPQTQLVYGALHKGAHDVKNLRF